VKRGFLLSAAIVSAALFGYFALSHRLTAQNGDYLTPQLREQVDQLKLDAGT
jgi:hypothetical protein